MLQLRVLVQENLGVQVESSTKLIGSIVPIYEFYFLSAVRSFNLTFISADPEDPSCSEDGQCSGEFSDLQLGIGDFTRPAQTIKLASLGRNLTTASIGWEYFCYLAYKKQLKQQVDYSTFFDFIYSFESSFWSILLLLLGLITILMCLTIKYRSPSQTISKILLNQFEAICIRCSKITNKNFPIFLFNIQGLLLLLVGIILSCSLRTGLVASFNYLEIESLEDVSELGYKMVTPLLSNCRYAIEADHSPVAEKISSEIEIVPTILPYPYIQLDKVSILDRLSFSLIKYAECGLLNDDSKQSPFDHSKNLIYNSQTIYLINKNNQPTINTIIIRRSYSIFEHRINRNEILVRIVRKKYGLPDAQQSCLDPQINTEQSVAPISLKYLSISFTILTLGYILGLLILLIQNSSVRIG